MVGEVSGIPYFLLLLLTDLSLVPDSEVMLEVRGRGEEERRGEEKETSAAASSHSKKETTGSISINHTPLQFALLKLEVTSRHFQTHVDTGYIPIPLKKTKTNVFFSPTGYCVYRKKKRTRISSKKQVV